MKGNKILHISTVFSSGKMEGVNRKLVQQAEVFSKNGVDMYVINRDLSGFQDGIHYVKIGKISFLQELLIRGFKYFYIHKYINLKQYEKVIIRYTFMDLSFFYFSWKYSGEIYTEHHTIELQELMAKKTFHSFKLLQLVLEKIMLFFCASRVSGVVGVSSSIAESAQARFDKKESYIFSNGISIQPYQEICTSKEGISGTVNIIFCASSFKKWHGLDRILAGAESYFGKTKVVLNLAGNISSEMESCIAKVNKSDSHVEVKYHGVLKWRDLLDLTGTMDLGVDSLGLHRLGILSGSTLKSKEYAALGIPFIYSAEDVDFKGLNDDCLFRVSQDDCPVIFDDLVYWFNQIEPESISKRLRVYSKNNLTWEKKINGLVQWLYK